MARLKSTPVQKKKYRPGFSRIMSWFATRPLNDVMELLVSSKPGKPVLKKVWAGLSALETKAEILTAFRRYCADHGCDLDRPSHRKLPVIGESRVYQVQWEKRPSGKNPTRSVPYVKVLLNVLGEPDFVQVWYENKRDIHVSAYAP